MNGGWGGWDWERGSISCASRRFAAGRDGEKHRCWDGAGEDVSLAAGPGGNAVAPSGLRSKDALAPGPCGPG